MRTGVVNKGDGQSAIQIRDEMLRGARDAFAALVKDGHLSPSVESVGNYLVDLIERRATDALLMAQPGMLLGVQAANQIIASYVGALAGFDKQLDSLQIPQSVN